MYLNAKEKESAIRSVWERKWSALRKESRVVGDEWYGRGCCSRCFWLAETGPLVMKSSFASLQLWLRTKLQLLRTTILNLPRTRWQTCKELFHFTKSEIRRTDDNRQNRTVEYVLLRHHLTQQHQVFGHLKVWHRLLPGLTGDEGLTATTSASMVECGKIIMPEDERKRNFNTTGGHLCSCAWGGRKDLLQPTYTSTWLYNVLVNSTRIDWPSDGSGSLRSWMVTPGIWRFAGNEPTRSDTIRLVTHSCACVCAFCLFVCLFVCFVLFLY